MKQNRPLDANDILPENMRKYLSIYGFHFSKRACEFAVSLMRRKGEKGGEEEPIEPLTKQQVDELLKRNGVTLENRNGYDYVYVAAMCKADMYHSSIEDERHVALYIKDVIDDVDDNPENIFRCWLAKMTGNGVSFDWYDLL